MATLTDEERLQARAAFNQLNNAERNAIGITKADLAAAVAAIDSFFDTNAAAINNAIPQPARTALTTRQKAILVTAVIRKRYGA
jgi:hypothetical protein